LRDAIHSGGRRAKGAANKFCSYSRLAVVFADAEFRLYHAAVLRCKCFASFQAWEKGDIGVW